ncbi:IS110 family transposase [Paeniglutamicibacter gangotriensis]|uniref:Transposase IS116/IS110/IS902 family protein n=1 Tax=Paeniglutamicibacter gangotriensis Lz1y TaxID=1276920 RepID=M7MU75_9MICC|nr:IS110 family transposase [Paeniglutamicibacter gangotriensis]EMQ99982.1 Transposase IS116/IS110/IS902 family protein [Paeniglutamicibacter gangotriensis Lz1y]
MSIVSPTYGFVVGVDTHAKNHVYAIINAATGEHLDTRDFPTTVAGINRAITWAGKRTGGDAETLWVIEGTASYGAVLAGTVSTARYRVTEAPRMSAKARHGVGKSDPLDARRIATAALPLPADQLRIPRLNEGVRAALRVLLTARDSMTGEKIIAVSKWRERDEALAEATARAEAIRLAKRIIDLDDQLKANVTRITELVSVSEAAALLEETGFGPVTAAVCLTTWSHHGRVRSEAAYASLAGVKPIPASSGNTVRHRLNRGGDRQLNKALHIVAMVRMTHDEETRKYTDKRTQEGRTTKEIRRCINRYLSRKVYRILNAGTTATSPT